MCALLFCHDCSVNSLDSWMSAVSSFCKSLGHPDLPRHELYHATRAGLFNLYGQVDRITPHCAGLEGPRSSLRFLGLLVPRRRQLLVCYHLRFSRLVQSFENWASARQRHRPHRRRSGSHHCLQQNGPPSCACHHDRSRRLGVPSRRISLASLPFSSAGWDGPFPSLLQRVQHQLATALPRGGHSQARHQHALAAQGGHHTAGAGRGTRGLHSGARALGLLGVQALHQLLGLRSATQADGDASCCAACRRSLT